jgi:FKBP-type peptidyl-prolyl cis-trans isomerase
MRPEFNKFYVLLAMIVSVMFSCISCKKETSAAMTANQNNQISQYLAAHNITIKPTASGLYYQSTLDGTGDSPGLTDFVTINYAGTTLDGKLFDTSNQADAKANNIVTSSALEGPVKLNMQNISVRGLIEGLLQMKEGGKAWMLMPASLTFNDYIPRIYDVTLVKVIHDPVAYENEKISTYLDSINRSTSANFTLSLADSTTEGIYYIETLAGTGLNAKDGDNVNINYSLKLIDGQSISSNTSFSCKIGDPNYTVGFNTIGFNAGIKKMKKGGKAIIIIPYNKAYGISGLAQNYVILIPMYSTLVYQIELKSIN